jgi:hypothetical protein
MTTQHTNGEKRVAQLTHEPPLGVTHGSFSLPATALSDNEDTIERLLTFAFDVLDLRSVELRVYEQCDKQQDGGY